MPIGPYKNFAACVAAQRRKGKSEEAAKKICGEIEKRSRGQVVEKAKAWIGTFLHSRIRNTQR